MENMQNMGSRTCGCGHHKVMPTLAILFGLVFLLGNTGWLPWDAVNILWPLIIIMAGAEKFAVSMCKCC